MKKPSLKINFIYQMSYELILLLLPLVTSPYISRVIGAEGIGKYSLAYSAAYYFVLCSKLGLKTYGNREIAKARDDREKLDKTFSELMWVHTALSVVALALYAAYIRFLAADRGFARIMTLYVISGLIDISWFYFGIENFRFTVSVNFTVKILAVISLFLFVRNPGDSWIYCLIMALGLLLDQIALWVPLHKYVSIRRPVLKDMLPHLKPLLILFIPYVAVSLYKYMDKVMLGYMSSAIQLGFYENAEKVTNLPVTVITSFGTIMLPKMSNLSASGDVRRTRKYIQLSMQFVNCLAIGMTCGLVAVAAVFAPVFWGTEFSICSGLITGLAFTIPFISFANVIRTQYLVPNSKDREFVLSVSAGAVVNLVVNTLLIPKLASYGAMIGTIVAEAAVCIIQVLMVRKTLPIRQYLKDSAIFLAVGIVMCLGVYLLGVRLGTSVSTLIIQVLSGAAFYALVCFVILVRKKNELLMPYWERIKKHLPQKGRNKV